MPGVKLVISTENCTVAGVVPPPETVSQGAVGLITVKASAVPLLATLNVVGAGAGSSCRRFNEKEAGEGTRFGADVMVNVTGIVNGLLPAAPASRVTFP